MTTIAQYAAAHDMQPYEVAAYLNLGVDYSDQDELTAEEIAMLTIPADITDLLERWGIDYLFDAGGINVGDVHIEMDGADFVVKEGGDVIAITIDTDKAASLLAFPLARKAWSVGYTGDFDVDISGPEMSMHFLGWGWDATVSAAPGESDSFTIMDHPLSLGSLVMSDLDAVLTSAELAYGAPDEAWQVLCNATDFGGDKWPAIIEFINSDVRFDYGDQLTKVESYDTDLIALVGDHGGDFPVRVIDTEGPSEETCWSHGDVAAAVLHAIS